MPADLLKPSEVAQRLGVSAKTVLRYIHDARLEAIRTPGGDYRIPELALLAFLGHETARNGGAPRPPACRRIAVTNQKGGVGKTTTAVNLAVYLARRGARVLLVDSDPQSNTTKHLGINPYELERSLYDVLHAPLAGPDAAILRAVRPGLDLLPAKLDLAAVDQELNAIFGRERLLKKALAPVLDRYDYILIDCPPSLGLLTFNALMAATEVLIPLQVEPFAVEGMAQLQQTVELVQGDNPDLVIGGIVCTMYDGRNNLSEAIEATIRTRFGLAVYQTVVPRNVTLSEASGAHQPVAEYAAGSRGAAAYAALAEEVAHRGN